MGLERRALGWSAVGNLLLGVVGLVFAQLASSGAILLDGAFNLVFLVMGLLTLRVAGLVEQPDDHQFHFGYAAFEPLINSVKGLLVLAVSLMALWPALQALFGDGRPMNAGPGSLYGGLAVLVCLTQFWLQRGYAQRTGSPLVQVDAKNWLVNAAISSVVALAFVASMLLQGRVAPQVLDFVDPALVSALVLLTLPVPLKMVRDGVGELLMAAPERGTQDSIVQVVEEVLAPLGPERTVVRMARTGRHFTVLVHAVVPAGYQGPVEAMDGLRQSLRERLIELHPRMAADIFFTRNPL